MTASGRLGRSPLATWVPDGAGLARLRSRLGHAPFALAPRDRQWRGIVPAWDACLALASRGLPFHAVAERRYDRSGNRRRLASALGGGATVYFPQIHEVLPRVARLVAAIRATLMGPFREECSFLFMVEGQGRDGMGLHHDGAVDAIWVQLEGRRTVTIGPRVGPRAPQDLDNAWGDRGGPGWRTLDLPAGTLFHLPPFTPHRVVCRGRSLALSLTWARPRRHPSTDRARCLSLASWPIASGRASPVPPRSRRWLWTQVPAALEAGSGACLWTPAGRIELPDSARALAARLAAMPRLPRSALRGPHRRALERLLAHGVLDDRDLPAAIAPADAESLEGWRFS